MSGPPLQLTLDGASEPMRTTGNRKYKGGAQFERTVRTRFARIGIPKGRSQPRFTRDRR